jgi:integrase
MSKGTRVTCCGTLSCPQCGSRLFWKSGLRYLEDGRSLQRWLCRQCGHRYSSKCFRNPLEESDIGLQGLSEPPNSMLNSADVQSVNFFSGKKIPDYSSLMVCKDVSPHCSEPRFSTVEKGINAFVPNSREHRVCASTEKAKNLAETNPRLEAAQREGTSQSPDAKGKLVEFSWWLKKQGYAESTIITRTGVLEVLSKRGANLNDTESLKDTLAKQTSWSEGRKANAVKAYTNYLRMVGGKWQPPICRSIRRLPFIPTEKEIDQLIAGCSRKVSILLQMMKETGMRCGEAWQTRWIDLDAENNTIRVAPEKNSNPRMFKISSNLMAMMNKLPKDNERIFGNWQLRNLRRTFERQRNAMSYKLNNPRLHQITFHTLRHWKATMEYHKTKDILHVMQMLGHKNIKNTLMYTQLIQFKDDDYVCKAAKTLEQAKELVEAGFEFICDVEGVKLFRKRK